MNKNREHFVTCGQMRILEKRADENGLSYYQMMETAGSSAAEIILEIDMYRRFIAGKEDVSDTVNSKVAETVYVGKSIKSPKSYVSAENKGCDEKGDWSSRRKNVLVFCGKGNNGGDGFVTARILCNKGYEVTVILVDGKPITSNSKINFSLIEDMPITIVDMKENERALIELREIPDIIIDAIYGTGFQGALNGNALKAAIYINNFSKGSSDSTCRGGPIIFALDIPSGISGDLINEKYLDHSCVCSDYTIVFHAKKPVHLQKFASGYFGRIVVCDIGIDEERLWNVEI